MNKIRKKKQPNSKNEQANGITRLHIIYENEGKKKMKQLNSKNEQANRLTRLHIIYENEGQEKEIAEQ